MRVSFRTTRLLRAYQESAKAIGEWGPEVGRRYVIRIAELHAVADFREARDIRSMRLHALKGSKKGELSIYLTGRWRLIVTRGDTEEHVVIQEVSNHYDD